MEIRLSQWVGNTYACWLGETRQWIRSWDGAAPNLKDHDLQVRLRLGRVTFFQSGPQLTRAPNQFSCRT